MDIIHASEARKLSSQFVYSYIEEAVEYTMKKIYSASKCGQYSITLTHNNDPIEICNIAKLEIFKDYIESLGYSYSTECDNKLIIITWEKDEYYEIKELINSLKHEIKSKNK